MSLYFVSVVLHVLAAITWVGGMAFLMLVVVPWMRRGDRATGAKLLRETGTRFRTVGWVCFVVLFVTGAYNLYVRGVRTESLTDPDFLASGFGKAVVIKLAGFVLVLVLSAAHDFVVGPRATRLLEADPRSPAAERMRRHASLLGRANALLALVLVIAAVGLVRGF